MMNRENFMFFAEVLYSNSLSAASVGWCRNESDFISSTDILQCMMKPMAGICAHEEIESVADLQSVILMAQYISSHMTYDAVGDEDARKIKVEEAYRTYRDHSTDVVTIADKIYKLINPNTTMNVPSNFYERIEQMKRDWLDSETDHTVTFEQYCTSKI